MADFRSAAAEKIEPAASHVLRVPLFGSLIERLDSDNRCVIMDLGPAQAATVAFFNSFRCRLDIIDLPSELERIDAAADPLLLKEQAESVLPTHRNEATDIVLCWDLLNYMQRPLLTAVMERVAVRLQPGSLVHALIVYSSRHMPVSPGNYFPGNDSGGADYLVNMPVTTEVREAPQYTPETLLRCMPAYRVERAVLLSNGMQEFLFRFSG